MSLYRQFESKENLLRHTCCAETRSFGHISTPVSPNIPASRAAQLRQLFVDLAARTSALTYRGCHSSYRGEFPTARMSRAKWWPTTKRVYVERLKGIWESRGRR